MSDAETVEVTGFLVKESEKAYLIDDGIKKEWCPRSQVEIEFEGKALDGRDVLCFTMSLWLAKEKGFI